MRTTRILSPTRFVLASLALVLLLVLTSAEARRYSTDESNTGDLRPHRHRHRYKPTGQRWLSNHKRVNDNDDYEDVVDYDEYQDSDEYSEEEDYATERRTGTGRLYPPKRAGNNHRYEPRYSAPTRYHHAAGTGRGHKLRGHAGHHRGSGSRSPHRKRYKDEDEDGEDSRAVARRRYADDVDDDDDDLENEPSGYYYKGNSRKRIATHSSDVGESKGRRSRYEPRKDWRYKVDDEDDYAYDADDEAEEENDYRSRKYARKGRLHSEESEIDRGKTFGRRSTDMFDEWMKKIRQSHDNGSRPYEVSSRKRNPRPQENEQSEDDVDEDEDDVELWKDDTDDKELDNDFYKNDEASSSALKTYDDIIRRLTEEDDHTATTTTRPTTQMKHNSEIESHLRRDAYGNLRFYKSSRYLVDAAAKAKNADAKKSLLEYEEEDAAKGEDEGIQADANTDYVDDENEAITAAATTTTTSTTMAAPMTSPTTTTTSITTAASTTRRNYDSDSSGAHYNGYQAKNDYPAMSAHSALKWQYLGTRDTVKETRNNMSQFSRISKSELNTAHNHVMQVAKEGRCQLPRERVIAVLDAYPNSMATYLPHCAILHRCTDDTGCCKFETLTCAPKRTERVELYFFATYDNKTEIEKLSFENHTECECRERKNSGYMNDKPPEYRAARHYPLSPAPQNIVRPPRKPCRCPSQFTPKITVEGVCECSCVDNDQECWKLQHGKIILSLTDRTCIKSEQCMTPKCTFGEFIVGQGRCPKKKDRFEATVHHRTNFNYYHRRS